MNKTVTYTEPELQSKLIVWEEYYNKQRAHSSLRNKTPWEKYKNLENTIPSIKEIQESYDTSKELFAVQNYKYDQELKLINKQRNKLLTYTKSHK